MKGNTKLKRAKEMYSGFKGTSTMGKVFARIPDELIQGLTSKQIATVAEIVAKAYNDGRASTGCEMIDKNAIWVNSIGKIIELVEEGAEYADVTEEIGGGCTHTILNKKIKDGIIVPRIADYD